MSAIPSASKLAQAWAHLAFLATLILTTRPCTATVPSMVKKASGKGVATDLWKAVAKAPKRPEGKTVRYLIKDIPPDLWKAVRIRALQEDRKINQVMRALLERYAKRGLD